MSIIFFTIKTDPGGHILNEKNLSVIISVLIVFTSLISMITVSSAASDGADIPVIHVSGYGALLVRNNSEGAKETVYPLQIPDGYIEEKAEEFLPIFAKAFFTQEWTEFCDTLVDILVPVFEPIALDSNGGSYRRKQSRLDMDT